MKEITSQEWTVLSMLEWATSYFSEKGIPSPRLSIEWLLAEVLDIRRLDLYLKYNRPLSANELDRLRPLVRRRGMHEPLQYILGYTDFMNCRISVDERVLIPRVETEQLVEKLLHDLESRQDEPLTVIDIGTGSGCIPIAIAKNRPCWHCYGIDISERALSLAKKNAEDNDVSVNFYKGDLFYLSEIEEFTDKRFDLVVSNPPYVLPDEKGEIEPQVLKFEPELALFHEKPLDVYKSITEFSVHNLTGNGILYLECNAGLTQSVCEMMRNSFQDVRSELDYDEKHRFVIAKNPIL